MNHYHGRPRPGRASTGISFSPRMRKAHRGTAAAACEELGGSLMRKHHQKTLAALRARDHPLAAVCVGHAAMSFDARFVFLMASTNTNNVCLLASS